MLVPSPFKRKEGVAIYLRKRCACVTSAFLAGVLVDRAEWLTIFAGW